MKSLWPPIGVVALFSASAIFWLWWAVGSLDSATLFFMGKGSIAIFGAISTLATLLLREVGALAPKQALGPEGLRRLRVVQHIVQRRLWAFICVSTLGVVLVSISAFGDSDTLLGFRIFCVAGSLTIACALAVLSVTYLPSLYFDLQRASRKLEDMNSAEETRKSQLKLLSSSGSDSK
jgi:hypothetical protein